MLLIHGVYVDVHFLMCSKDLNIQLPLLMKWVVVAWYDSNTKIRFIYAHILALHGESQ